MKKMRSIIALIIAIIAGGIYVSDTYLGIDIIGILNPDETVPVIDVTNIPTTVEYGSTVDLTLATCTDNRDDECEVVIVGTLDTNTAGMQDIEFMATDEAGNFSVVSVNITVLEEGVVLDLEKPVIDVSMFTTSLNLADVLDLTLATCTDNIDTTCLVTTTGTVDVNTEGDYDVTFTATDAAGNTEEIVVTFLVRDGLDTTIYVPDGYYDTADGLTGETLKDTLNDIITNHTEFPYTDTSTDVWDLLRAGDEDPLDEDNVILFYSAFSWYKECQDTTTANLPDYCFVDSNRDNEYTEWNREHIWSKSHGDFEDEDGYAFKDEDGGYALGAHTDAHHLVAAERSMNSTKNNRFFDDCHDGVNDDNLVDRDYGNYTCGEWYFEPRDEVKGDVARMLFYMATRYEGEDGDFVDLELTTDLYLYEDSSVSIKSSKLPYYENLEVLLRWHMEDPVSEWELERNETIYGFQGNRNPFIDHPEYVELIWGTPESPVEYVSETNE